MSDHEANTELECKQHLRQSLRSTALCALSYPAAAFLIPLLQTELDWLLDDAMADWQEDCSDTKWAQTTWKQLQRKFPCWQLEQARASAPGCVRLRASLHQLQNLWEQRLRER